ncbi:protein-(glutamine-N5) methyltransferase, release factor-specific [Pseudopedobacter saltans DSM 12145]|uniref:peptide chain release factor N(5)-glutamine methyltransferase n=1 Tax=Pseudopedobacter saltans (strain ATCC 51119 / DSM 12145 / JCM 21818 / CCUG 39354 / LMG 10337 / NBRC 100064 / NCIMB 13643) TaxID=762903 RepID=F0SAA2_PSESL|nr:peptide chain release factor N(5)-glutamine methyltransferase [Pseudopedobacter saltans]ADY51479.1 protein-(glutamine-N5) methyltransferase, release factor-specific [Pseudopedobacter saltans DSM 12145]
MKLSDIKNAFELGLKGVYDEHEAEIILKYLLEDLFAIKPNPTIDIEEHKAKELLKILDDLKVGKPVQQIIGKADFYGYKFIVNEHVLIPRPETEELVHEIVKYHKHQNVSVLDIGTGSACISVSIKKGIPEAIVYAIDVSREALTVAKQNALMNGVDIDFYLDDALNLDAEKYPFFDVIVSNPPYIRESEKKEMHSNVLSFEPHLALFVKDKDPLIFYDKISDFALKRLNKGGFLYFEINQYLAKETEDLIHKRGFKTLLIKDINSNFRILKAQLLG